MAAFITTPEFLARYGATCTTVNGKKSCKTDAKALVVSIYTCTMAAIQIKGTTHSVFPGRLCTLCGLWCMVDSAPHALM